MIWHVSRNFQAKPSRDLGLALGEDMAGSGRYFLLQRPGSLQRGRLSIASEDTIE